MVYYRRKRKRGDKMKPIHAFKYMGDKEWVIDAMERGISHDLKRIDDDCDICVKIQVFEIKKGGNINEF